MAGAAPDLSPLELHALKVAGKAADKKRDALEAGNDQSVDFTVRVHGPMHVGQDDAHYVVTEKVPLDKLLGLVLDQLGPKTRDKVLLGVANQCAEFREENGSPPDPTAAAHELAVDLIDRASRQKPQPRRGPVTGTPTIERL